MTEQPTSPAPDAGEKPHGTTDKPHGAAEGLRGLRRSRDERMLAGVLGGLAQRLGIDPVLLRIVTVVLAVFGGVGIVIYAAGWLLIPDEGADRSIAEQALGRSDDRPEPATLWLAGGLTLAVLFAAGATFGSGIGPVLLVLAAAGVIVLMRRDGDAPTSRFTDRVPDGEPTGPTSDDATTGAASPDDHVASGDADTVEGDTAAEHPSVEDEPHGIEADEFRRPEPSGAAASGQHPEYVHSFTAEPASAWPDPPDWPASDIGQTGFEVPEPPVADGKPPRSNLGALTLSVAAVALGILAIVDAAGPAIPASAYVALALAIIGAGLLIGAWFGRSRGLIALGLIGTLIALPVTAVGDVLDWDLTGEDRLITIDDAAELPEGPQSHGMGRVVYDLTDLEFPPDDGRVLDISQNVGQLQIIVPPEVDVTLNASTGMGHIAAFDTDVGGHQDITVTDAGPDGAGGGVLTLDLSLKLGEILVERADLPATELGDQGVAR
ncbi:MAG TPA: PspC domain-containing protein [Jiangellaceae bacterium]